MHIQIQSIVQYNKKNYYYIYSLILMINITCMFKMQLSLVLLILNIIHNLVDHY